jgi:PAS domain S-box-containing protein
MSSSAAIADAEPQAAAPDDMASRLDTGERIGFLATTPARPSDWRLALGVIVVSVLVAVAAAPFARTPLPPVGAFIPVYQSALVVGDFVTAVLLFGQCSILRSRALLVLACGYLFCALIATAHLLTFPGLFSPAGLLGAGPQSTAWLYVFWHGGFPIAVVAYALLKRADGGDDRLRTNLRIAQPAALLAVICAVVGLTALATAYESALPVIMAGNHYTSILIVVVGATWALSFVGIAVLWMQRPHTVLDVWLMVVLCAWVFDVALSAVLNAGRFDLGFYAGRLYGLLAAGFVLSVMLVETTRLYGRLALAAAELKTYAGTLEDRVTVRTLELERSTAEERRTHRAAFESARKLEEARSINQRIFETAADLMLVTDRRGSFIQVSPSALAIIGYRPEELIGRVASEIVFPDDLENTRTGMRNARRDGQIGRFETRYIHKLGRVVPLAWAGVWSEPEQRYFFTGRDMTEHIAAEEQLRHAHKMEAVGQLTGGVAHDFNNLLGVVIGNLDLLQEQLASDAESAELLGEALGAALKGADVTRQLLAFSRRQALQPKRVEPNEIVRGMSKLLTRAIGEQIDVRLHLPEDAWPVVIDPVQLESAMLNLAVNARDAMPSGGTLVIETANLSLDADEAGIQIDGSAGDYVMIAISDSGSGMRPEIVARVFEPFFSTKGVGKGTGLGLSMVYGFVKQSGGNAKIYSEPGIGTTVRLYLPRAGERTETEIIATPPAQSSRGGARILVVEDNEALRRLALRQLGELGYDTVAAGSGAEALAELERDSTIDLLFTDVMMPGGMDGRELARRALALRPDLKVLFTSGFTAAAAGATIATELADKLISKPFRKHDLERHLRVELERGAPLPNSG